jgi:AraC-like DNA-binding protein
MPRSTVMTFTDPYDYQTFHPEAEQRLVVTVRGHYRASLTFVELYRLQMESGWQSLPTVSHASIRKDRSMVLFPADAAQPPPTYGGVEVHPGQIVVAALAGEFHGRSQANVSWGLLSLTADDLAAFGRAPVGRDLKPPPMTCVIRPGSAAMSRLLSLRKAADHLAATVPDVLAHPEVARAIEQELVRTMIACLTAPGATERLRPSRQTIMRRFEQVIEAHQDEPLYVADLCKAAGVSQRTLQGLCQDHLGMGPHRYLWLRRMQQARRALTLADGMARTVTEIANDHGCAELGPIFDSALPQIFERTR